MLLTDKKVVEGWASLRDVSLLLQVCCWQFDSFIYCFNIEYLEILNSKTSRTPRRRLKNKVSKCQRGFIFNIIWRFYILFHSIASLVCYGIGCNHEVRAYFKTGVGPYPERSDHRLRQTLAGHRKLAGIVTLLWDDEVSETCEGHNRGTQLDKLVFL